jgi:hypothetical protein
MNVFKKKFPLTFFFIFFIIASCGDSNHPANQQDPSCGNKTLPEIVSSEWKDLKWTKMQHKNNMNALYYMLEAKLKINDENIKTYFKYNEKKSMWEQSSINGLGYDTATVKLFKIYMKVCF